MPKTTILAPHGGGIEPGTSELCLAVAGYHPANLPQVPPAAVTYDYWMFEGIREAGNAALHVTSTGCDDGVAVSLCAGSLNALSLHGFDPAPEFPADEQIVLVGGANPALKDLLLAGLCDAHIKRLAAGTGEELNGSKPCNIVNRTLPVGDPRRPWAARNWSSARRCAMRCSPRTAAPGASTPPPSCSGPSWACAATRSTGSKPSRAIPRPGFDV